MAKKDFREEIIIDYIKGIIYRLKSNGNIKEVGNNDKNGYLRFYYEGKNIRNHRFIYEKYWNVKLKSEQELDHIDQDKKNNSVLNLRILTRSQNIQNSLKQKNCSSIYKGVSWFKRLKTWRVQMRINGKQTHLGYFENELEAYLCWKKEAEIQNKLGSTYFIPSLI